jgi:hypothetical protein
VLICIFRPSGLFGLFKHRRVRALLRGGSDHGHA